MKNSIEVIWKEGFLNEKSLVAPQVNDLYNQKSKDLVERMKRMYRNNIIGLLFVAIFFLVMHYLLDVMWQGLASSALLLFTAGYSVWQKRSMKTLDHGATSLDYLKSFDRWLKDALLQSEKVMRFTYPLYLLIALSTMWSAWNKGPVTSKLYQRYPDMMFIGNVPWFVWIIAGVAILLMCWFSGKIFRWDVRLMYGRVFDKLEQTIAEMERLKQE